MSSTTATTDEREGRREGTRESAWVEARGKEDGEGRRAEGKKKGGKERGKGRQREGSERSLFSPTGLRSRAVTTFSTA